MWCSEDRGWVAKRRRRSALPLSLYLALLLGSVGFARSATLLVPEDYATIQAAVDASVPGDTVLLRQGLYRGPGNRGIDFRGKDIVLKSISGPEWTVLDCENADRGFYFHEGESRAARVEGIGIWNGQVGAAGVGWGGGLHIQGSDPTISDCIIQYCEADDGGGVYVLSNGSRIERCVIRANIADGAGGGIVVPWGAAEIVDCVITGNGVFGGDGGGLALVSAEDVLVRGCTISGNCPEGVWIGEPTTLENCIIWGNGGTGGEHEIWTGWSGASLICCAVDTTGVTPGAAIEYESCVYTDPLFCQQTWEDWTLDAASPCLPEHSPCGSLIGAFGLGCGTPTPTGACCRAEGGCAVLPREACEGQGGTYLGDGVPCEPDPCDPTPAHPTSWGRIKAVFRGAAR